MLLLTSKTFLFAMCVFQTATLAFLILLVSLKVLKKGNDGSPCFQNLFVEKPAAILKRQSFSLPNGVYLTVAEGTIEGFTSPSGAIVSPVDSLHPLGCPGVDGAILKAGGEALKIMRKEAAQGSLSNQIGRTLTLGPYAFGKLGVPFVIHAFCPNFNTQDQIEGKKLLYKTYWSTLDALRERPINQIAFPLLSTGEFLGDVTMNTVIEIAIRAVKDWSFAGLPEPAGSGEVKDIVLFASTQEESSMIVQMCNQVLTGCTRVERMS